MDMSTAAEMVTGDSLDEDAFRAKVQAFLQAHASPRTETQPGAESRTDLTQSKSFQSALYQASLAGLTWPREYGGQGLPGRYQTLYNNEAAQYDLPTGPFGIGFGMCMPTVLTHGTDPQKERFVRPALKGEEIWCQLFSEPSSGSDLASLRTSVVRDGDEWILNGQKVWTSGAHYSQYAILLARSDPNQPKHRGLSMFILDMGSPGITVRPLRQMTGQAHFNEVFFDDVRIPADRILAEPGDGWRCAITVLMNERVGVARSSAEKTSRLAPISTHLKLARSSGLLSDPLIRQDLMDLVVRYWAADLLGLRQRQSIAPGGVPGPDGSLNKLGGAILTKRSAKVAARLAGPRSMAWSDAGSDEATAVQMLLSTPSSSIAGGSNQVMRNILGERVLGLAKEPGIDPGTPFRDLPYS
jgi:alkylation response protein AidB-like acyl-CoA dehydrogenase